MENPLILSLILINGSQADLIRSQLKTRAHFLESDRLVIFLSVCMMTEGNEITIHQINLMLPLVRKGQNSLAIHAGNREEVLEDVGHTLTQLGCQVTENQVGIGFTHRPHILDIMSHYSIRDVEVGCRTVGEMTDDKRGGFTTMLIHNYNVCKLICTTGFDQLSFLEKKELYFIEF